MDAGGFRFGDFELDGPRFELRRRGARVPIQPKALDVLLYLVRHRERVVGRDELLDELWPDAMVTEGSVTKAIGVVRRILAAGGVETSIETVRGRGFRFVAPVSEQPAAEEPLPPGADGAPGLRDVSSGFVGRRDVLSALDSDLAEAARGHGRLVVLAGEAGIGKTRTAQEATARADGARVLFAWCDESGGAPALWPWIQLLRQLEDGGAARPHADLGALMDADEPNLGASLSAELARFRLFDTLNERLRRAAVERPLLLVLDDLHWADADSLAMLRFLARDLRGTRRMVLATCRDHELPPGHALLDLARWPDCELRPLAGLDRAEVAHFMELELGAAVPAAVSHAVHARCEGNPFFVRELTRLLAGQGSLESQVVGDPIGLPRGVRDLLRRRLDALSPPSSELLDIAAVMGADFDLPTLTRASGRKAAEVLECLDAARSARLVQPLGDGYRFAHALLRDATLERIPDARRARLHRHVAEALEAVHGPDPGPALSRIAYHYCEGAAAGCAERALDFARRAGDRAARSLACDEAVTQHRRALAVLPLCSDVPAQVRCELLLGLGEALMAAGRGEEGRDTLRQCAELARAGPHPELLARAAIAAGGLELTTEVGIEDPELVALLEEALEALGDAAPGLRVRLRCRLFIASTWTGTRQQSLAQVEQTVAEAEALGEPVPLAHALHARRLAHMGPHDVETRLADCDRIFDVARRSRHRELEVAAHSYRFQDLLELGRVPEADRELATYERLVARLRIPRYRWRAVMYRSMRALLDGRLDVAEELIGRVLAEGRRIGAADADSSFAVQLATLRWHQDRIAELEAPVKEMVRRFPAIPAWRAGLAFIQGETGSGEARETLRLLVTDDLAMLPRDVNWMAGVVMLAEASARVGDAESAAPLYRALLPCAPRLVRIGPGTACWGSLDRSLGLLAATLGQAERGEAHLARAVRENARVGARPWLAMSELEHARVLVGLGRPEEARAAGERARELALALGMPGVAARATGLPA